MSSKIDFQKLWWICIHCWRHALVAATVVVIVASMLPILISWSRLKLPLAAAEPNSEDAGEKGLCEPGCVVGFVEVDPDTSLESAAKDVMMKPILTLEDSVEDNNQTHEIFQTNRIDQSDDINDWDKDIENMVLDMNEELRARLNLVDVEWSTIAVLDRDLMLDEEGGRDGECGLPLWDEGIRNHSLDLPQFGAQFLPDFVPV